MTSLLSNFQEGQPWHLGLLYVLLLAASQTLPLAWPAAQILPPSSRVLESACI